MDHLPNPLDKMLSPSSTRLPTQPLPEQVEAAKRATKRLMSSFPDYGKAPPDYMVALMECLTWLSPEEMGWVMDPRNGLATTTKFLPTPGDVHEFLRAKRERAEQFKPIPPRGLTKFEPSNTPPPKYGEFRPFPKLWEAFASEPDLLQGKTFDQLSDASKALATQGKDRARDILSKRYKQPGDAA